MSEALYGFFRQTTQTRLSMILLCGPSGGGKSQTAFHFLSKKKRIFVVDADGGGSGYLAASYKNALYFSSDDPDKIEAALQAAIKAGTEEDGIIFDGVTTWALLVKNQIAEKVLAKKKKYDAKLKDMTLEEVRLEPHHYVMMDCRFEAMAQALYRAPSLVYCLQRSKIKGEWGGKKKGDMDDVAHTLSGPENFMFASDFVSYRYFEDTENGRQFKKKVIKYRKSQQQQDEEEFSE